MIYFSLVTGFDLGTQIDSVPLENSALPQYMNSGRLE